jgi:hypothetical protein
MAVTIPAIFSLHYFLSSVKRYGLHISLIELRPYRMDTNLDDATAAHLYRLEQAKVLIRHFEADQARELLEQAAAQLNKLPRLTQLDAARKFLATEIQKLAI